MPYREKSIMGMNIPSKPGLVSSYKLCFVLFLALFGFSLSIEFNYIKDFDKFSAIYINLFIPVIIVIILLYKMSSKSRIDIFQPLSFVIFGFTALFIFKTIILLHGFESLYLNLDNLRDADGLCLALFYGWLWLACCGLGYYSKVSVGLSQMIHPLPPINWNKFLKMLPALVAFSVGIIILRFFLMGGIEHFLAEPDAVKTTMGFAPISMLSETIFYIYYLSIIYFMKYKSNKALLASVITGAASLAFVLVSFSKSAAFTFIIIPVAIYFYIKRKTPKIKTILTFGIITLLMLWVIDAYRYYDVQRTSSSFSEKLSSVQSVMLDVIKDERYDILLSPVIRREGIEVFAVMINRGTSLEFFDLIYRASIALIPRAVWPNKPMISEGTILLEEISGDPGTTAAAISIPASSYRALDFPGIIIFGTLFGIMLRMIYCYSIESINYETGVFFYAMILQRLSYFFETDIITTIINIMMRVIIFIGIIYFIKDSTQRNNYQINSTVVT